MGFLLDMLWLTLQQVLTLVGVIIFFGICIHFIENKTTAYIHNTFGTTNYFFTSWIGTPIHELGHYIMCKIFRFDVIDVQWFPIDRHDSTLGYVNFTYNRNSIIARIGLFFVSVAPLFSGTAFLIGMLYLLLPGSFHVLNENLAIMGEQSLSGEGFLVLLSHTFDLIQSIFVWANLVSWQFWVFLLLAIAICTHMSLSPADLKIAMSGFWAIPIFLFLFNCLNSWLNISTVSIFNWIYQMNMYLAGMMLFAICLSGFVLIVSMILYTVKSNFLK